MRWKSASLVVLMCLGYGVISLFSAYSMLNKQATAKKKILTQNLEKLDESLKIVATKRRVEIWDTSGVGMYLWQNILQGNIPDSPNKGGWFENVLKINALEIKYRLGYAQLPQHIPPPKLNSIILALNGRDKKVSVHAHIWITYILGLTHVTNIGLLILGNEFCDNEWLEMHIANDKVKFIYLIYDSNLIDNKKVFQWPLGVASYRRFPSVDPNTLDIISDRKYACNFLGTLHPQSSRNYILDLTKNDPIFNNSNCYFTWRKRWAKDENEKTLLNYLHALMNSDITLSPVGINAECYRTYEAMEYGSIPIIEDIQTPKTCNNTVLAPYAMLKQSNAPVIYLKNWKKELPSILNKFNNMSLKEKVQKRRNLLQWYKQFKSDLKLQFIKKINDLFLWSTIIK